VHLPRHAEREGRPHGGLRRDARRDRDPRDGLALAARRAGLRLPRPRPRRADVQPARAVRRAGRGAAPRRAEAGVRAAEALRAGHGLRDDRDRRRARARLRARGRGGRAGGRAGRGGRARGDLRVLPRLQGLRPAHAGRPDPRRGLRGVRRHLVAAGHEPAARRV
ncbi:MAG: hypothetical protein AVDCRST_MAG30-3957, partial [uncultured Solirubrobacteraceae bacterium]